MQASRRGPCIALRANLHMTWHGRVWWQDESGDEVISYACPLRLVEQEFSMHINAMAAMAMQAACMKTLQPACCLQGVCLALQCSFRAEAGHKPDVCCKCRYNTYRFNGSKRIVLSTASWIGGHNTFLGVAYLTVGGASVCCSVVFFLIQSIFPRALGDASRLSFSKSNILRR